MDDQVYTGVGSRETPLDYCMKMYYAAERLAAQGWAVRSGHADGADSSFEKGARKGGGRCEIFIPWEGFNKTRRGDKRFIVPSGDLLTKASEYASQIHPAWNDLPKSHRLLHARNVFEVLGPDLESPSKCLVCWTVDGHDRGGTRTAIVLARAARIPILNLGKTTGLFGKSPSKMTVMDIVAWVDKHK